MFKFQRYYLVSQTIWKSRLFFFVSKTVGSLLVPPNCLIFLGLLGSCLLLTRFKRLGRCLLAVSIVSLALCSFTPVGALLLYPLESRFPDWDVHRGDPDGIIVLGGSIDASLSAAQQRPVFRQDPERIIAMVVLAKAYPNARVVFSGGTSSLVDGAAKEADYVGLLAQNLGIDKSRIWLERQSRNTDENAKFSKEFVHPKNGERWLLVTSAYHMPRSVGLFRKAGFPVEPYPVGRHVVDSRTFYMPSNAVNGLYETRVAAREWIGLLTYWATGRIDELLPGPARQ